jgi:hypothetical protein
MNIQTITDEIRHKLNHLVSIKMNSYLKTLENVEEEDKEAKISIFVTDLTFQVTDKVIKQKLSKMNPKPLSFVFHLNRQKYFEQTVKELMVQVNEEVYFDEDEVNKQKLKFSNNETFEISFNGYFLEDYSYIGSKKIAQPDEIRQEWFPSILSCLRVKEENQTEAENMLNFLKDFVSFGFNKAIEVENVFIDIQKMNESLSSVDFVSIGDKKLSAEEFIQFREDNMLGKKKKSLH